MFTFKYRVSTQYMKTLYLISFLLIQLNINISGQIRGTVTDKSTGHPIQFASVFIKGQDKGASTDLNGSFMLNQVSQNATLIISAIGYETREINSREQLQIELVQKVYELPEVKVIPKTQKLKLIIDPLKKIKSKSFTSPSGVYPWIVTKFFEYREKYNTTPVIKQIQVLTLCHLDSATFNLRLFAAGSNGEPGNDILKKNLIISTNKRDDFTSINLVDYNISFPENGLYIGIEWLIVDQNLNQNLHSQRSSYDPMIGIVPDGNKNDIWMFSKGQWYKSKLFYNPDRTITAKIAIELTLTN